jgi:thymidylate synthase (FAD)
MSTKRIRVLDHGYIELLDSMGDDAEVARAARQSYGNSNDRSWELDAKLTKRLYEDGHTSPFEMVEVKFKVRAPIFVARQWVRHRTANWSEFSMRYADASKLSESEKPLVYIPEEWRGAPPSSNHQGSVTGTFTEYEDALFSDAYETWVNEGLRLYKEMQEAGVANEMARFCIPVTGYTEFVWKNDLHNTLKFLKLRTHEGAQKEMREYAEAIRTLLHQEFPKLMAVIDAG